MLLVPAVLHILGRRAWYMPRWLDRTLPRLTIEPDEDEQATAEVHQLESQDLRPAA
jgi:RND superfamily putative drug exporter